MGVCGCVCVSVVHFISVTVFAQGDVIESSDSTASLFI